MEIGIDIAVFLAGIGAGSLVAMRSVEARTEARVARSSGRFPVRVLYFFPDWG
jgi:hypothetical protein